MVIFFIRKLCSYTVLVAERQGRENSKSLPWLVRQSLTAAWLSELESI